MYALSSSHDFITQLLADEERLVADMIELTRQYGRYGYRRIAIQ